MKRKYCGHCKEKKLPNDFHKDKSTCKDCLRKKRKPSWSKTYWQSDKGKAVGKKAMNKYLKTDKGKEALTRLRLNSKIKQSTK